MPYARNYTVGEVRAILDSLAESRNPHPPLGGMPPPAHTLGLHWAVPEAELKKRSCGAYPVNPPGAHPAAVSCFKDFDTVVQATTAAMNSPAGQLVLAQLDPPTSATSAQTAAGGIMVAGQFPSKRFQRTAKASAQHPTGTGDIYRGANATSIFFKVYRHVQLGGAERLWIQTSYPATVMGGMPTPI